MAVDVPVVVMTTLGAVPGVVSIWLHAQVPFRLVVFQATATDVQ